mgnify:CR=1 FL=1
MGYKLNGSHLPLDVAFTDSDGASYPASWLRNSTEEQRAAVPTGGRFYWGVDKPHPIADLKKDWIQKQKEAANQFLAETDWLIIRKSEAGTAVPSDTTTYRAAVRTKCKEREDQITACSDTDALAKLVNAGETREKFDTSKEIKDKDGNSYDPKRYESFDPTQYEQNPDGLKQWPTS